MTRRFVRGFRNFMEKSSVYGHVEINATWGQKDIWTSCVKFAA